MEKPVELMTKEELIDKILKLSGDVFYAHPNGKHFHAKFCRFVDKEYKRISKDEIKKRKLECCLLCLCGEFRTVSK